MEQFFKYHYRGKVCQRRLQFIRYHIRQRYSCQCAVFGLNMFQSLSSVTCLVGLLFRLVINIEKVKLSSSLKSLALSNTLSGSRIFMDPAAFCTNGKVRSLSSTSSWPVCSSTSDSCIEILREKYKINHFHSLIF